MTAVAIVLECAGAPEGPVSTVRSLGRAGLPVILVTEAPSSPATASRYVQRVVPAPGFSREPERLIAIVEEIAGTLAEPPVLIPTADPDLLLASTLHERLRGRCRVAAPPADMVLDLSDKRRFARLAERLGLPVPRTIAPASLEELRAASRAVRYPAIVKPAQPLAWKRAAREIVGPVKAVRVDGAGELMRLGERLAPISMDFLVQELIPGPDDGHVDMLAFCDGGAAPVGWFTARKHRVCPPHAGSGCYLESVVVEPVVAAGLETLRRLGHVGSADLQFKRDERDGRYLLIEINPRPAQWHILSTRCGLNLSLLAWRHACGLPLSPAPRQTEGIFYVNFPDDRRAFQVYRREGSWTAGAYARSLLRWPMVHQYLDPRDPGPALRLLASAIAGRMRREGR